MTKTRLAIGALLAVLAIGGGCKLSDLLGAGSGFLEEARVAFAEAEADGRITPEEVDAIRERLGASWDDLREVYAHGEWELYLAQVAAWYLSQQGDVGAASVVKPEPFVVEGGG